MTLQSEREYIEMLKKELKPKSMFPDDVRTEEEKMREQEIYEKALKIGINLKMTDGEIEDSYYRDMALKYIIEGKEIPEELLEKIEVENRKAEKE